MEHRKMHAGSDQISTALGVDIVDPFQKAMLSNKPMYDKMNMHLRTIGDGTKKIGSSVLNLLGGMQGQSELLNAPGRLNRMVDRVELMKSNESI